MEFSMVLLIKSPFRRERRRKDYPKAIRSVFIFELFLYILRASLSLRETTTVYEKLVCCFFYTTKEVTYSLYRGVKAMNQKTNMVIISPSHFGLKI